MALPTPYLSNTNGTTGNGFYIADASGLTSADTLALENTTGGILKLFKADGTTLAQLQVGTPSNNDDVATKSYVDGSPAANAAEQIVALSLAFGSGASVTSSYTLPNGAHVTKVQVQVQTAFDGTTPTVSVGYSGQTTKFMATTDNNLALQGVYTKEQYVPQDSGGGGAQAVLLSYSAGGSTVGAATVLVWFVIQAKI